MPVTYEIDTDRRLVLARGTGLLRSSEIVRYMNEVWTNPEVVGFDAVFDLTNVEDIEFQSSDAVRGVAEVAARTDSPDTQARLAIVATADYAFGVSRMYQSYRQMHKRATKEVAVFRSFEEALTWIESSRESDR